MENLPAPLMVLVFLASLVPSVLVFLWLKKRKKDDLTYNALCVKSIKRGALMCIAFVVLTSAVLYGVGQILKLLGLGGVPYALYYNFMVLAFSEELVKYNVFKAMVKKNPYQYSMLDITSLMMITGIGFEITEAIVYAFGANFSMMIARGVTVMHGGYGFIMGYFIAKAMKSGKKSYNILGFAIPFLLHGAYDFFLSDELAEISDKFAYISLVLAIVGMILIIVSILHIRKSEKNPEYTEPLVF